MEHYKIINEEINMESIKFILMIIYLIVGYWAVGVCFYEGKVIIYQSWFQQVFSKKLIYAAAGGWIFIPAAIIKKAILKK